MTTPILQSRNAQRPRPRILLSLRASDVLRLRHWPVVLPLAPHSSSSSSEKFPLVHSIHQRAGISLEMRRGFPPGAERRVLMGFHLPAPHPSHRASFHVSPRKLQFPSLSRYRRRNSGFRPHPQLCHPVPTRVFQVPKLPLLQGRSTVLFLVQRSSVPAAVLLAPECLLDCQFLKKVHWPSAHSRTAH